MNSNPADGNNVYSLTIDQFTVSVLVEDEEVPLYAIEHSDDERTVTCWVESEAGKSFGVRFMDSERICHTASQFSVDGILCGNPVNRSGGTKGHPYKIDYCNSGSTRRKLVFSDIQTTDDDAYYGQTIHEEFGSMKLVIRRVEIIGDTVNPWTERHALEKVHERSKKAMRHQMKLGEEVPPGGTRMDLRYFEFLGTFIIRYRPKDYLQANDIIPRPKKRKAETDDIIDLTVDDDEDDDKIRELQAQIQAIQERKKQKSNKRVKTEVKHEFIEL